MLTPDTERRRLYPFAPVPNARPSLADPAPSTKRLSILIPSLVERASMLARLTNSLDHQLTSDVEVLVNVDNRQLPSGAKRNQLLTQARGEYVAFIDDDDLVSDDYVQSLLNATALEPDVVTFDLTIFRNGKPAFQSFSLKHGDSPQSTEPTTMSANHLSAWKRSIATQVRFPDWLGYGDDQVWYKPLVASGLATTEQHIDKILYFYHFSTQTTCNQTGHQTHTAYSWVGDGSIHSFWHGPKIVITREPSKRRRGNDDPEEIILVYDHTGVEYLAKRSQLRRLATFRIV